jgi:hypothetical protein
MEEERQTARLCFVFSSSSSLSEPVRSGRCVAAEPILSLKTGSTAASYGAQEGAPPATARGHGSSILGFASSLVARVGEPLTRRQRRHGRAMESRTIPAILGEDLAATPSGAASRRRRDSSTRWVDYIIDTNGARLRRATFVPDKKSPDRSARGPHSSALEPDPAPSSVRAD